MTVKELVYIILDLSKGATSDDSYLTEDHIIFLCKKYRAFLLKKEQEKNKGAVDTLTEFETQNIKFDLQKVAAIDGEPCTGGYYLRSTQEVPTLLEGYKPTVYPIDFYQGINISFIPRSRMRYVGTNKFLRNIIYVSIGADKHLYLTSNNPQFSYLNSIHMNAAFEDFNAVTSCMCDATGKGCSCDVLDAEFPLREYLVPPLIELVIKEVVGAAYRPVDTNNNAADDLSDMIAYIRRNMKSSLQKQIEE